jgi:hypothetical protein
MLIGQWYMERTDLYTQHNETTEEQTRGIQGMNSRAYFP